MKCWHCGSPVETIERVGFRDCCPKCDRALHCCRNCDFYDISFNNQCRETMAERVVDKDRANFCEYFTPAGRKGTAVPDRTASAREKLDALFKKKP